MLIYNISFIDTDLDKFPARLQITITDGSLCTNL